MDKNKTEESFNPKMDFNQIESILDFLMPSEKKSPISDRLVRKVDEYFEKKKKI